MQFKERESQQSPKSMLAFYVSAIHCMCHVYIFTVCVTYLPSQRPLLKTSVSASVSTKPPDIFTILGQYSAMFAGTEPGKPKHDFFS